MAYAHVSCIKVHRNLCSGRVTGVRGVAQIGELCQSSSQFISHRYLRLTFSSCTDRGCAPNPRKLCGFASSDEHEQHCNPWAEPLDPSVSINVGVGAHGIRPGAARQCRFRAITHIVTGGWGRSPVLNYVNVAGTARICYVR